MNGFAADPVAGPYWDGCARHELWVQQCMSCGTAQFYPRALCASCGEREIAWERASGRGSIYAITRVDRPPVRGESGGELLALVELDEGPRVLTHIVGAGGEMLPTIGTRVSVTFASLPGSDLPYPVFRMEASR